MGRSFPLSNPECPRNSQCPIICPPTTSSETKNQTAIRGHGDGDTRRLRSARTCPSMKRMTQPQPQPQPDAAVKARASLDSFRPGSLRIKKFDGKEGSSSNWNSLRKVCCCPFTLAWNRSNAGTTGPRPLVGGRGLSRLPLRAGPVAAGTFFQDPLPDSTTGRLLSAD